MAKALARFVFKDEEDFVEEFLGNLFEKRLFQLFLCRSNDSISSEGVLSVALSNFFFAPTVVVVLVIHVEGLLKDSEVVGVVGGRQQVLLLEVIDWSQATKLCVRVSYLKNNSMFFYHKVELVADND